jgi:hypothetical protein
MAGKNQGSRSRNVKEVPVRVGRDAQEQRVRGVSQYGQAMGNHPTEGSRKLTNASEKVQGSYLPKALSVELGNAAALRVGKGGPGADRKLYGQSGSNQTYGPTNPGVPGLPSTKGQWPD